MRIGILTHLLRTNYGGVLQNYALQTVLTRMGYDVKTINYTPKTRFKSRIRSAVKSLLGKLGVIRYLSASEKSDITVHFQEFISTYIRFTRLVRVDKLRQLKDELDTVVVGSDQVWRPRYVGDIECFFLKSFVGTNVKKIAYAASFGVSDWEFTKRQTENCSVLAKHFNSISVREQSGIQLCSEYLGVAATHVLDPTMLLQVEDYLALVRKAVPKDCIMSMKDMEYVYVLDKSPVKDKIVDAIGLLMGLNSFVIMPPRYETVSKREYRQCVYPSIPSWLAGFSVAKFVVTDSFHGTVFSILFNKPFLVLSNSSRGNERLYSILSDFGLLDRIVDSTVCPDGVVLQKILNSLIDWNAVNRILEEKRLDSYNFLKDSLKK